MYQGVSLLCHGSDVSRFLSFCLALLCLQESESRWQTRLAQMTLDLEQKDSELRQTVSQMGTVQDKLTQLQVSTCTYMYMCYDFDMH